MGQDGNIMLPCTLTILLRVHAFLAQFGEFGQPVFGQRPKFSYHPAEVEMTVGQEIEKWTIMVE